MPKRLVVVGFTANHVIKASTPVRRLADCIGATYVLSYQRRASDACRVCVASAPHPCALTGYASDTGSFTSHICQGNRDEGCSQPLTCLRKRVPIIDGERLSGPPPVLRHVIPLGAAAVLAVSPGPLRQS
jgi:hypothetical protein